MKFIEDLFSEIVRKYGDEWVLLMAIFSILTGGAILAVIVIATRGWVLTLIPIAVVYTFVSAAISMRRK